MHDILRNNLAGPAAGAESMPSGGKLSFSSTVSQPECDSEGKTKRSG
jgi:hypothetical protein